MTNTDIIKSPLNYTGGKHKLLPQILPLFPETDNFLDLFAGGANVGINTNAKNIIFNDKNTQVIELFQWMCEQEADDIIEQVQKVVAKYNLSDTTTHGYAHYGCDSGAGLAKYNKESFLKLREAYNKDFDPLLLYTLIVFSFNNQIRFNRKGEYNLPSGKRDFNTKMQDKLVKFIEAIGKKDNVRFTNIDFYDFDLDELESDTLIYCDPPYLITTASYNENGGWNDDMEHKLLSYLDDANQRGFKFALSNVLSSKNQENTILSEWLASKNYTCHKLEQSYANSNYQRKNKDAATYEVLITNY